MAGRLRPDRGGLGSVEGLDEGSLLAADFGWVEESLERRTELRH